MEMISKSALRPAITVIPSAPDRKNRSSRITLQGIHCPHRVPGGGERPSLFDPRGFAAGLQKDVGETAAVRYSPPVVTLPQTCQGCDAAFSLILSEKPFVSRNNCRMWDLKSSTPHLLCCQRRAQQQGWDAVTADLLHVSRKDASPL